MEHDDGRDEVLTSGQVAALLGVSAKTVGLWAREGKLRYIRTLGGHRRYRRSDVERAVAEADHD